MSTNSSKSTPLLYNFGQFISNFNDAVVIPPLIDPSSKSKFQIQVSNPILMRPLSHPTLSPSATKSKRTRQAPAIILFMPLRFHPTSTQSLPKSQPFLPLTLVPHPSTPAHAISTAPRLVRFLPIQSRFHRSALAHHTQPVLVSTCLWQRAPAGLPRRWQLRRRGKRYAARGVQRQRIALQ